MDEKEYQAAIPKCCKFQTAKQHYDVMLLCWGITHGLVQKEGESYCETCEMHKAN